MAGTVKHPKKLTLNETDIANVAAFLGTGVMERYRVEIRDAYDGLSDTGFDRMVLDLLDLCVMDSGQLQLHRAPTDLKELVQHVVDRMVSTHDRHREGHGGRTSACRRNRRDWDGRRP